MPIHRSLIALACALLLSSAGAASGATNRTSELKVQRWETDEGLPHKSVLSMVQARDGYLWIGTPNGLVRFNGIDFTNVTPTLHDGIVHLFEDSGRTLWIGTENKGTLQLKEGRLAAPAELAEGSIERRLRAACEDNAGAIWLYYANGDLWRCAQDRFSKFAAPPDDGGNRPMICETNGTIWLGTLHYQYALRPGAGNSSNQLPITETNRIEARGLDTLVPSPRGGYWRLANVEVQRIIDGNARTVTRYVWPREVSSACEDGDGNLVLGTKGAGLFIVQTNGEVSSITTDQRLSDNFIFSVLVDREGTLWVGTDGGLNCVKRETFYTLEASRNWAVKSVAETDQGELWIATERNGLGRWAREEMLQLGVGRFFKPEPYQCVFVDREQRVWVSSADKALYQIRNGQPQGVNDGGLVQHTVQAIYQDRAGRMWFGTAGGLLRLEKGEWKSFTVRDGLTDTNITALADDASGNLWIGTLHGGVNRLHNEKFSALRKTDGAPSDNIAGLVVDEQGVLWATTSAGLGRWQSGNWTRYTTREGLAGDALGYLLDDGAGNLWLGSSVGLLRASKKALTDLAHGTARAVPCSAYGKLDGLPTRECTFGSQPGAWRGRNGTLWFSTGKGVGALNAAQFRPNTNPPPVAIESILVDELPRTRSPGSTNLVLRPGDERLDIQYASLNLSAAERARFRYRLEGFEKDWIERKERMASYPRLPAGHYTFHVTAANEDGVWNETGASLAIFVQPPFWRTWWFSTITALCIVGMVAGVVHYFSTQKLQRQLALMRQKEALEKERARIARDIHDQVGASLTQVALLGELVETDKDSPAEVETHAQQISQTARETTRALDEIVWTVNPQNDTLEGLVNYICKYAQDYLAVAGIRYRFDLPAQLPARPIAPDVRHNVFLASKEAVTNIVRHAKASAAWIRLSIEDGSVTLEVEDNGRGVAGLDLNAARTRHGLKNMSKRMEDIGGQFSLGPGKEGGALVRLMIPLGNNPGLANQA